MHLAMRRVRGGKVGNWPVRPEGQIVWIHVARAERLPALLQLATRLVAQRASTTVLVTAPVNVQGPRRLKPGMIWCEAPDESVELCESFVRHFKPDICVWTSGDLRPCLVHNAAAAGVPLVLVNAEADGFGPRGIKALRQPTRTLLKYFTAFFASDAMAATRLERLGVPPDQVEVVGPLQEGSAALSCRSSDLADLSEAIGTRPVWLAAMVQSEETMTILRAHRNAARFSHRLLLILVPDRPDMAEKMQERCEREGLKYALWSDGAFPEDSTEVLIGDTMGEMGLWYRLASVSFMASSLVSGKGGCDPFEPAALGSAVLYGPNCGRHLGAYSKLVAAGGARMVRDVDSMTAALRHLSGPDRAAAMALAAWEVVSEGAQVTDRVTDMVQDILDIAETY